MTIEKHIWLAYELITKEGYKLVQFKNNGLAVLKKGKITLKLISK